MAAGSSSHKNFRKALAAIKDSTSVGMAKVNSEYKALTVSILKATNHVEVLPKEKHIRSILGAVSGSRPRADVAYCLHTLMKRLAKTSTWAVALKTLIVIHRALREVDESFCEELIYFNRSRGHVLSLFHFNDGSTPAAWYYSAWIRAYALYLEECLECFRVLKYDFHRDHSRAKKMDVSSLFEHLPALQKLLYRLLNCQPVGAAQYNSIILYALSIVALESVRLYVAITDGVLILVHKVSVVSIYYFHHKSLAMVPTIYIRQFFEMPYQDAVIALEIYRKAMQQAHSMSEFFDTCKRLDFGRGQKYVTIEQLPASFLADMEEYINNARDTVRPPSAVCMYYYSNVLKSLGHQYQAEDKSDDAPRLLEAPEANLEIDPNQTDADKGSKPSADSRTGTNPAAPLIPDLMSWDELSQDTTENSSLNTTPPGPDGDSNSWESMLLAETISDESSVTENTRAALNILDRYVLDSLYNTPKTPSNPSEHHMQNISANPFEGDTYNQMYCDQSLTMKPSFMQADDQHHIYGYMQIAGMTQPVEDPQQEHSTMADYDDSMNVPGMTQQESSSYSLFIGHDYMQMSEVSRPESPMQEHEQAGGHEDSPPNPFRNPFEDQYFAPEDGATRTTTTN
ncbi:putative clathrin assembly protein At5g35200 isoform X2 [Andrographis paniculata]|uniref:putative clathrin assembly protein At5g35200 isoform X2 n=1 Tax=Andrographis paniculata TaxID=175694 RepID=UPI0021E845CB|nr:putative clathrin assembly protein At5g35200 isoform X2 [Andrographis paniculata]